MGHPAVRMPCCTQSLSSVSVYRSQISCQWTVSVSSVLYPSFNGSPPDPEPIKYPHKNLGGRCRRTRKSMNPRLVAAAESRQLSRILALSGGPREARKRQNVGRLRRPAALRAAGPRFARLGLTLQVADLCRWYIRGEAKLQAGQGSFEPRYTLPKLWKICFDMASFGHLSVRICIKPFSNPDKSMFVPFLFVPNGLSSWNNVTKQFCLGFGKHQNSLTKIWKHTHN